MAALKAAGHRVAILTGASTKQPTQQDLADKAQYLKSLGMGSDWDTLVIFPDPPEKRKAKWCKKHGVAILIDDRVKNAELASKYCTVLIPYNSIVPQKAKEKA